MKLLLLFLLTEPTVWDFLLNVKDYVIPLIVGLIALKKDWIADKLNIKQKKQNIEGTTLENLQSNLTLYQNMVDDIDTRYKERIAEFEKSFEVSMDKLKGEISELNKVNNKLEIIIKEQKAMIQKLSKSLTYYEKRYGQADKT